MAAVVRVLPQHCCPPPFDSCEVHKKWREALILKQALASFFHCQTKCLTALHRFAGSNQGVHELQLDGAAQRVAALCFKLIENDVEHMAKD